jgi:hypothetical protein
MPGDLARATEGASAKLEVCACVEEGLGGVGSVMLQPEPNCLR